MISISDLTVQSVPNLSKGWKTSYVRQLEFGIKQTIDAVRGFARCIVSFMQRPMRDFRANHCVDIASELIRITTAGKAGSSIRAPRDNGQRICAPVCHALLAGIAS